MRKIETDGHVAFDCHYHFVWVTKYRLKLLEDGADERLKEVLYQVADERGVKIEEVKVMPDHVHVVVAMSPNIPAKSIMKSFKGRSSHILTHEFPNIKSRTPSLWTRSYFVATTGGANLSVIKQYVASQKLRGEK